MALEVILDVYKPFSSCQGLSLWVTVCSSLA